MLKRKIALISAFPPSGGSLNEYGFHMAQELAMRDDIAEVVVIADIMDEPVDEPDHGSKIRVVRCWKFNGISTPWKILSALRKEGVDGAIYNVQTASFGDCEITAAIGLLSPLLSRLGGIKTGVLTHNLIEGIDLEGTIVKDNWLRQMIIRAGGYFVSLALTRANYVTTTLDLYANVLKQRFPRADVSMVPHGTFRRPQIDLPAFGERKKRIVTMGKYGTYKRLETLIEAFVELYRHDKSLELVIGGTDHPNAQGYMAGLEKQYSHMKAIRFHGYVAEEDVPGFFANARLAVFDYSTTTGSSGVMHQCASYGAVPVFPRIGDFVELCEREGMNGYNYNPGDVASMAKTMKTAIENEEGSEQIAKANLAAVDEYPLARVMEFHVGKLWGGKEEPGWSETHSTKVSTDAARNVG